MSSYMVKAAAVFSVLLLLNIVIVVFYVNFETIPRMLNALVGNHSENDVLQIHSNNHKRNEELEKYLVQREVKVTEMDCGKMFHGDRTELRKARRVELVQTPVPNDTDIQQAASDCTSFLHSYGFIMDPLTDLENNFPIAFSILAYKQATQVVDLLKTIYRPQNFYCIHGDQKSSQAFHLALRAVTNCFPNVFIASRAIRVKWGTYTVLEPEIVCMQDLWQNTTWKYFINLTGQEFPLKTNYELVRVLSALKGANDVVGTIPTTGTISRWKKFLPAPHNITVYKGGIHVLLSRAFVDYVLHNPIAQDFLQWCQQTKVPDEHYFSSLNHNPHLKVPGSYKGKVMQSAQYRKIKPSLARYKNWGYGMPCPGKKIVHHICILSVLDLPILYKRKELFANKFYADYSQLALRCLAETLYNRTRDETLGRLVFNASYYEQLPFIQDIFK